MENKEKKKNKLFKNIKTTIDKMVFKFEDYKYAEDGFEDTTEYNQLKDYSRQIKELYKNEQ